VLLVAKVLAVTAIVFSGGLTTTSVLDSVALSSTNKCSVSINTKFDSAVFPFHLSSPAYHKVPPAHRHRQNTRNKTTRLKARVASSEARPAITTAEMHPIPAQTQRIAAMQNNQICLLDMGGETRLSHFFLYKTESRKIELFFSFIQVHHPQLF
jgi:hypothetical protein